MKEIHRYQCDACGTEYKTREAALRCESSVLPPFPAAVGAAIEAYERYDPPEADRIVSFRVGPDGLAQALLGWDERGPEGVAEFNAKIKGGTHTWLVKMDRTHRYGKDDNSYSDEYDWSSVRLPGAATWLDGSPCRP